MSTYQVCYKNWRGEWYRDRKTFRRRDSLAAKLRLAFIKQAAAANGRASLQLTGWKPEKGAQ